MEEARNGVRQLLKLYPRSTIARWRANTTGYYPPKVLGMFIEGFHKAGLPEG
jgi:hypothetical protein